MVTCIKCQKEKNYDNKCLCDKVDAFFDKAPARFRAPVEIRPIFGEGQVVEFLPALLHSIRGKKS